MIAAATFAAQQLSCYRDECLLFSNLNFSLSSGEALLITGPNGIGKSSLLRILSGLSMPQAGNVRWCQEVIGKLKEDYRQQIAYLGHKTGIKLALTVKENLQIAAALNKSSLFDSKEILEKFNLQNLLNKPAQQLSAGQKQRLALVSILQSPAKLWLLDEPLTALDTTAIQILQSYLQAHLDNGGMLVMASHQPLVLRNMREINLGAMLPRRDNNKRRPPP